MRLKRVFSVVMALVVMVCCFAMNAAALGESNRGEETYTVYPSEIVFSSSALSADLYSESLFPDFMSFSSRAKSTFLRISLIVDLLKKAPSPKSIFKDEILNGVPPVLSSCASTDFLSAGLFFAAQIISLCSYKASVLPYFTTATGGFPTFA